MNLIKIKEIKYYSPFIISLIELLFHDNYMPFIGEKYLIKWIIESFHYILILVFIVFIIDIINSSCLGEDCVKIREDFSDEKFKILMRIKKLLKFVRWFGMVKRFLQFYKCISLSKTREKITQNDQDKLIVFILIILFVLWYFSPTWQKNNNISNIVVFLAVWRLIDILSYQLSIIFTGKENGIKTSSFPRSIALFLINLSEVIFIYAILYLRYEAIIYTNNVNAITEPFEALYFSIITISTTGFGDIIPNTENIYGKFLALSEIAVGILLLVIFFGIFISRWKSKYDKWRLF